MTERADAIAAASTAERLAELADIAELMDDVDGAVRLRRGAEQARVRAMHLLDD